MAMHQPVWNTLFYDETEHELSDGESVVYDEMETRTKIIVYVKEGSVGIKSIDGEGETLGGEATREAGEKYEKNFWLNRPPILEFTGKVDGTVVRVTEEQV